MKRNEGFSEQGFQSQHSPNNSTPIVPVPLRLADPMLPSGLHEQKLVHTHKERGV